IFASVSVVAYAVTHYTQAAFEAMDAERTEALVAQFKKEFVQRGEEIAHQAKNIAEANLTERMAIDLSRPNADLSLYVRDAVGTASIRISSPLWSCPPECARSSIPTSIQILRPRPCWQRKSMRNKRNGSRLSSSSCKGSHSPWFERLSGPGIRRTRKRFMPFL